MNRLQLVLVGLGAILVVVLFWLLLWSPQGDEIDEVRADIDRVQDQQATTQNRITTLRNVRDEAPEIESMLTASASILPRDTALPSVLRQLQTAADESGSVLTSVSPGRPQPVDGAAEDLAMLTLSVQMDGSYFQIVDFLRRVEQADITPRGINWDDLAMSVGDYPELGVTLNGRMYAVLPSAPPPTDEPDDVEVEDEQDEVDVDVDVEIEE
jgi:Tfp pilus assembly protein PilO